MHQQSVLLAQRVHLFPFRTQKLSSAEPKILAWRRAGKIGHCRHTTRETWVRRLARRQCFPCILQSSYSSLAQSVEHLTVNQGVTGSSPVGGAIKTLENTAFSRVFCYLGRSERTSKKPFSSFRDIHTRMTVNQHCPEKINSTGGDKRRSLWYNGAEYKKGGI